MRPTSTQSLLLKTSLVTEDGGILYTNEQALATTIFVTNAIAAQNTLLSNHTANTSNPHNVTKAQLGLGNVNNTADSAKPVSVLQQAALDLKAPLENPTFTGTVTAGAFIGSGDGLTGIIAAGAGYLYDNLSLYLTAEGDAEAQIGWNSNGSITATKLFGDGAGVNNVKAANAIELFNVDAGNQQIFWDAEFSMWKATSKFGLSDGIFVDEAGFVGDGSRLTNVTATVPYAPYIRDADTNLQFVGGTDSEGQGGFSASDLEGNLRSITASKLFGNGESLQNVAALSLNDGTNLQFVSQLDEDGIATGWFALNLSASPASITASKFFGSGAALTDLSITQVAGVTPINDGVYTLFAGDSTSTSSSITVTNGIITNIVESTSI